MSQELILFILQDKPYIKDLTAYLDQSKFKFDFVKSAVEGIEKTLSELPSVLFLDLKISGIASHQVCRYLRSRHETKRIPIVVLSGADTPRHYLFWAMELGANDYLIEPIDELALQEKIKKFA
jgi:DNA-binding response OmpR family regulator